MAAAEGGALPALGRAPDSVLGGATAASSDLDRDRLRELMALRALCRLDLADLATHTPRPFEAYASGDHQPLVDALFDDEGMVVPRALA